jgi:predicted alpha/beta hydrolase
VRLALRRFAPPAATSRRAVALLTHAMMARGSYLARYASWLAEQGIEAWVLDFRGHGASVPPRADRGPGWSFDDLVREDIPAAIELVARQAGIAPAELAYVGHSLGGLAGLASFATGEAPAPRRLVLVAVNVWTRPRGLRYLAGTAFVTAARLTGRVPARTLRIGSDDEPRAYAEQFRQWLTRGFTARDGTDYRAALTRVQTPTLALVCDGDWMCRVEDSRELLARLRAPLHLRRVGRARGDALDPDHFAFFASERLRTVWQETADFIV